MDTATAALGVSGLVLVIQILNLVFGRGDKSEEKTAAVAKQVSELTLQISSLRTELAQAELARHQYMDNRFVLRAEFSREQAIWDFTRKLSETVYRRMHPDASFHESGAHAG